MAEAHPVGFQWVMEAKRARRDGHPRRPALHPHLGGRRPARADPGGLRHRVPRRAGQPRAQQRPRLPRVRRRLHQRREHHRRGASRTPRTSTGCSPASTPRAAHYDPVVVALRATRGASAAGRPRADAEHDGGAGRERGVRTPSSRTRPRTPRATGRAGPRSAGRARRDETLQHPRCVFQILKRHFARYTPEMVQEVCGIAPEQFAQGRRGADLATAGASAPPRSATPSAGPTTAWAPR